LLFTAFVTPYRIAFIDFDSVTWVVIDLFIDAIFAFDICLNFFTAFFDDDDNLIIAKKKIACAYLQSWFLIDLIAIFPISSILRNYSNLTRMAKLPRLYRLLKITKYGF
jgi:hypothetical protein